MNHAPESPSLGRLATVPPDSLLVSILFLSASLSAMALMLSLFVHTAGLSAYAVTLLFAATGMGGLLTVFLAGLKWPATILQLALVGAILDQWEGLSGLGVPYLTLSKVLLILAIGILAARFWLRKSGETRLLLPVPALAHLPFSFVCLVSTLAFASSYPNSIRWLLAPLTLPILSLVLAQFTSGPVASVRLIKSFALFSFFPMIIAGTESVLRRRLSGPAEIVHYGAQDLFRVAGNFENENDFVVLMLFSIPVLLLWAYRTPHWAPKLALLVGAAFQGLILLKTYSRSGFLSMGFAIIAIALFGTKKIRTLAVIVCLIGVSSLLSLPDVRDRVLSLVGFRPQTVGASQAMASLSHRKMLLTVAWKEFQKKPILGVGFGNFGYRVRSHSTLLYQNNAENTFAHVLAEMGLVGIFSYLVFWIFSFRVMRTCILRCRDDPDLEPYALALAAGYCGFVMNCFFDTNLADNLPWVLLPLLVHLSLPKPDAA